MVYFIAVVYSTVVYRQTGDCEHCEQQPLGQSKIQNLFAKAHLCLPNHSSCGSNALVRPHQPVLALFELGLK